MEDKPLVKVKDEKGWYRDPDSGAIVRVDNLARERYKKQRAQINRKKEAEKNRERRLDALESKVDRLTDLLEKALEGNKD